ncbi:MAG: heavy metal-associated domain-containing protein [Arcicella sp.]|nr:heavy metal-associated domain-containing protein [Arcicella sp.]
MKTSEILIENLKCGGCANSIKTRLQNLTGVFSVEIDQENSLVKVEHNTSIKRTGIISQLESLGYPEQNSNNTVIHKAKSFVSCAVGRMTAEA